jgi:hypothetical protein
MVARSIRADTVFLLKKPEKAPYDSEDITRINAVRSDARPTWFALLGALVFVGITLLGVRDVDFFSLHRNDTDLALVGVSVPVVYFFIAGSAVVTAA